MRIRRIMTEEEKVAKNIGDVVSDLRVDLERVGEYIANSQPYVVYNRIQVIAEAAKETKEGTNYARNNF
jgi:molybdopterin converting factor small subunit